MTRTRRFPKRSATLATASALWKLSLVKVLLGFVFLILTPYIGLFLAMHTYGIYAEPDSAEFTIDGEAVGKSGDFLYRGFLGSDDIECKFESGATTRIRVFPRFSDDNSSTLFIHENGDVLSYGDLRFERLNQADVLRRHIAAGIYYYPSFPSRMEGPSSSVDLPTSFESLVHLQAWARSLRSMLPALTRWNGYQIRVVRVLRSSELGSDFILVFASQGAAWKLVYANMSGVTWRGNDYGDLELAIDGSKKLVLKARGRNAMTIPFEMGFEAIMAALPKVPSS